MVTDDGKEHLAGLVIAGVGILANDALAAAAGLDCVNGIIAGECARTVGPLVAAAGDCTARRLVQPPID